MKRAEAIAITEGFVPRMPGDPYFLLGRSLVNVSGGRTSGYMLHRILQAHGGHLPSHVRAIFCNTGLEENETLDFLHEIETQWQIPLVWVEFQARNSFRVVTYETAYRTEEPDVRADGTVRPFNALIEQERYLPNQAQRICTKGMKILTAKRYARRLGWKAHTEVVGLRYDEPERVYLPLAVDKVTKGDVLAFWAAQPFDLQLEEGEGNCYLCHLKDWPTLARLMRKKPQRTDWWIDREAERDATFRNPKRERPPYRVLRDMALAMSEEDMERLAASGRKNPATIPCTCTD